MKRIIGVCVALAFASSYAQAQSEPYQTSLSQSISQVNLKDFTLVGNDGQPSKEPEKINDRVSKYVFVPSEYVAKAPGKDVVPTVLTMVALDGKVGLITGTSDVANFKETQDLLKAKYGQPIATRAAVRDQKAFENSVNFCQRDNAQLKGKETLCPPSYYEIYGNIDEAYTIVKSNKDEMLKKPAMLMFWGVTRETKNYQDSME